MKRAIFVAVALIIFGVSFFTTSWAATPAASRAVKVSQTNVKSSPTPSLSPAPTITATAATSPSPSPKPTPVTAVPVGNTLSIPAIGLTTSIVEVGTTPQNNIDAPAKSQAGHWTGSPKPGMPGAVFLDGHLVGGAFAKLNKLVVGQLVTVRYSGQTYTYKVVYSETVPLAGIDMNKALSVYGSASEGLNMMTCAGTYSSATGTYDQRLTVYTVRVS